MTKATTPPPQAQGFQQFLADYRERHPEDVLAFSVEVSADQEITAIAQQLALEGRYPMLVFDRVQGLTASVATNVFASRTRVARMLGVPLEGLHKAYQQRARQRVAPRLVDSGPVLEVVQTGKDIDLRRLPLINHFASDRAPYITNAVMVSEHPDTGVGNLSYHRSMLHSANEIATSLHSRGDLWRLLQIATERGKPMPVAMVIGAHPLFMLAASARVPFDVDERDVAGGLMGAPLEVVRTPQHGIRVPAHAEIVLEGVIDPTQRADEGPFGEFTGYSSNRSTNNLFQVQTVMQRKGAMLVDVLGGNSAEHLNLARIPRESEMAEKLMERFPGVTALHYPNSGTHFHAYVALKQLRPGEARQVMLGLLGWDPYLKTVIAVDPDVDVTHDEQVLWALATHFQPHRDLLMVDGLPGSALDPSASGVGTTSRMGLDATRGPDFDGVRAVLSDAAVARAKELLAAKA
ncbi:UbiD family decarboxylase [Hydrogenophaga sp.]|uniref:UbiD family decarboxylase n=1 Tax=Hydrogenophaga sp. TaxID=1904254 RepID=UPI003F729600